MDIHLSLPDWIAPLLQQWRDPADAATRLQQTVVLSRQNIEHDGGPFAALVTDGDGRLLGLGVNRVVDAGCSHWHAEMVAIAMAQRAVQSHDLRGSGAVLYSSCEPCAMCIGAILWSGVRELVYAALDEDARAIGFDEGPKLAGWQDYLRARGIAVNADAGLREAASSVLRDYAASGQVIY